jgi:hypothetical protein
MLLLVYATLEGSLSPPGESHAVYSDSQGAVVVGLKPIGNIVQAVTIINMAVGKNPFSAHLAGNRRLLSGSR